MIDHKITEELPDWSGAPAPLVNGLQAMTDKINELGRSLGPLGGGGGGSGTAAGTLVETGIVNGVAASWVGLVQSQPVALEDEE